MKKYTNEFKVGIFVVLCLAALAYLSFSTSKFSLSKEGYTIYAVFDEIAGLDRKAPVMLNGFEVGKVEDIKLAYDADKTQVVLALWLNKGVLVREDSLVFIKTLGLMGEKYIQIASSKSNNFIKAGSIMHGEPYADMDAMFYTLSTTVNQNKDTIVSITKNFEAVSKNFAAFSDDIRRHPWKLIRKSKENK